MLACQAHACPWLSHSLALLCQLFELGLATVNVILQVVVQFVSNLSALASQDVEPEHATAAI